MQNHSFTNETQQTLLQEPIHSRSAIDLVGLKRMGVKKTEKQGSALHSRSVMDLVELKRVKKKRQSRSTTPKKRSSKPRQLTPPRCSDTDDSSQVSKKSNSPRRSRSSKSKKTNRRSVSPIPESASKLQAMEEEITRLKSIQDQMERHQAFLEKQHRDFERQIETMELSLEMTESKNQELEFRLEEVLEENDRLTYGRKSRLVSTPTMKDDDSSKENDVELLRLENEILHGKLERCEMALLQTSNHTSSYCS